MTPSRDVRTGFERRDLPLVVVSAVALVSGGPLTILRQAVAAARVSTDANFLFLVHDAGSWDEGPNVRFASFPGARRSYLWRVLTEYLRFPGLSRRWRPDVWLSLHDVTPPVVARRQAVYCHNPLPYWRPTLRDLRLHPWEVVRSFLYGWVYRTNARRNDRVIGQLPWFTEFIGRYMRVSRDRLLVVAPRTEAPVEIEEVPPPAGTGLACVYASLPRVFKNFEEAIALCDQPGVRLTVTLSGDENRYARWVRERARGHVTFAGRMAHAEALAAMARADVVLFPSRLETFGLPVQEAIDLGRTLVLPVRPWTVAIAGEYPRAHFYRTVDEGRAILAALRDDREPLGVRPPVPESDLPRLSGFGELYHFLLR
ncbi:MAG TPA: glycosyltransferase [Actinomycetota bacterium]